MTGKLVTPQGEEIELTTNRDELTAHLCEELDKFRAGIITAKDLSAVASLGKSVASVEMLGLLKSKMANQKPKSKFLSMDETKQIGE